MTSVAFSGNLSIVRLASHHNRSVFSCGVDALDRYLHEQAGQDAKRRVAAAFVLTAAGNADVLGFYTLNTASVLLSDAPEDLVRQLPRYPQVPVILLGRLAVDQRYRGKRYGELLLLDALKRCLTTQDALGWVAVVVDAKDAAAVAFYKHFGFLSLSPDSKRLYLHYKTIAGLF